MNKSFEAIQRRAITKGKFGPVFISEQGRRARRADAKAGAYSRKSLAHEIRDERAHDDDGRDFSGHYEP